MKYFFDTEFIEEKQKTFFGTTKPTIDLISIGIVSEDNKEYYAISKDFNLKEAWNRFQLKINKQYPNGSEYNKEYWIRNNVLKPIYDELYNKENIYSRQAMFRANVYIPVAKYKFTYRNLKKLIKKYGKTNKEIATEVLYFCSNGYFDKTGFDLSKAKEYELYDNFKPEFYAYYADYDWVVFCWLFGKMIELPKGFPYYCKDLKQILDDKYEMLLETEKATPNIKDLPNYPQQKNEHNALADAKWNKELFLFLKSVGKKV